MPSGIERADGVLRCTHRRLFVAAVLNAMALASLAAEPPPKQSPDGLELLEGRRSDGAEIVYVRPGATLAAYKRITLDPVEVAFDEAWLKSNPRVSESDRESIRQWVAEQFRTVFAEELDAKGGYDIAQGANEPDVLRVTAAISDLYVQVPNVATPKNAGKHTVGTSRMTLMVELRDAASGAILARAIDRKSASPSGGMPGMLQWTTRETNQSEARRIFGTWAESLRTAMDSARNATQLQ